ncbi:MAG: methyltransferase [Phycisphaerae bacterium]|nr:methyltransferase [Phycisphaerae bacterium]
MTQTSREIIRDTLTFKNPSRIGRQLWVLPWAQQRFPDQLAQIERDYPNDIVTVPAELCYYNPSPIIKGDAYALGQYTDEWGCIYENRQQGVTGEVKSPIVTDINDLSPLNFPYEILPSNPQLSRDSINKYCRETDQFVLANCVPRPWERLQFICGTVNAMMAIMTPESGIFNLIRKIHEFYLAELEFWTSTDVDAIFFMDDWGSQLNLLIPPKIWTELFKPLYKDYCDLAKANNKFTFMHSDGCITKIYPELIEVGVDAVNSQLFCMDMEELAKIAKGKITFWGEIDRQHIIPSSDTNIARQAVDKVAKHLYDPSGGIIAQFELGPGANIDNTRVIFDQWETISNKTI